MRCERYQMDIQRFLDDDLNDQETKELFAHLEVCPQCKQEFNDFQRLHQQLLDLPKIQLHTSFIEELLSKADFKDNVYQGGQQPTTWFQRYRKYILPGLVAAVLLVAVVANQDKLGTPYAGQGMNKQNDITIFDDNDQQGILSNNDQLDMASSMQEKQMLMQIEPREGMTRAEGYMMNAFGIDQSSLDEVTFQKEDINRIPANVREWVKSSKQIFAGQSYVYGGKTYVYVSLGEDSDENLGVDIQRVYAKDDQLYVYADIENHQSSSLASDFQPDVLISVPREYSNVDFNEWQGAQIETWIPEIYDMEEIPDFYDQSSDIIKIYSPTPEETFTNSILIKGIARTFDGAVYYRLVTDSAEEIASGFIYATRGAPDWGSFEQEIFVDLPETIDIVHAEIEIYESLQDGGKRGTVNLPIILKGKDGSGSFQGKQWITFVVESVDVGKQILQVKNLLLDEADVQTVQQLDIADVPILRSMAGQQSEYAQIKDIQVNNQIGAVLAANGTVKEIYLFD